MPVTAIAEATVTEAVFYGVEKALDAEAETAGQPCSKTQTSPVRGSQRRCQALTGLSRPDVARRLSALATPSGATVAAHDIWLPRGAAQPREARLDLEPALLPLEYREELLSWWLKIRPYANTPNWDIASTCTVNSTRGLLLVEAKAHDRELSPAGKSKPRTDNGWRNHAKIASAIAQANAGLNALLPGWRLSRDTHYQLSNRLAWAWKLLDLGIPVILIYLGFLRAQEMVDQGQPFDSPEAWETCLRIYSEGIVPPSAWGCRLEWAGTPLWVLVASCDLETDSYQGA